MIREPCLVYQCAWIISRNTYLESSVHVNGDIVMALNRGSLLVLWLLYFLAYCVVISAPFLVSIPATLVFYMYLVAALSAIVVLAVPVVRMLRRPGIRKFSTLFRESLVELFIMFYPLLLFTVFDYAIIGIKGKVVGYEVLVGVSFMLMFTACAVLYYLVVKFLRKMLSDVCRT